MIGVGVPGAQESHEVAEEQVAQGNLQG